LKILKSRSGGKIQEKKKNFSAFLRKFQDIEASKTAQSHRERGFELLKKTWGEGLDKGGKKSYIGKCAVERPVQTNPKDSSQRARNLDK
jgi:isochorismate hydrolase